MAPDVVLNIIADFNHLRYAWQNTGFPFLSSFACGHNEAFDTVSLLAAGLLSVLKSIDKSTAAKYLSTHTGEHGTYHDARKNGRKLRIKVRTVNEAFRQLLNGADNGKVPAKLLAELKKESARFHVEGKRALPEDMEHLAAWSKMVLPSHRP